MVMLSTTSPTIRQLAVGALLRVHRAPMGSLAARRAAVAALRAIAGVSRLIRRARRPPHRRDACACAYGPYLLSSTCSFRRRSPRGYAPPLVVPATGGSGEVGCGRLFPRQLRADDDVGSAASLAGVAVAGPTLYAYSQNEAPAVSACSPRWTRPKLPRLDDCRRSPCTGARGFRSYRRPFGWARAGCAVFGSRLPSLLPSTSGCSS